MEFALEQVGKTTEYQAELARYVEDLRQEAAYIQTARGVVAKAALVAAFALFFLPIAIGIARPRWFMALPETLAASLIASMFAAGVLLISTLAKAVFRSAHERQNDEFIPPQIKVIQEITKAVKGG